MLTLEQQKRLNINEFRIRTQNKDTINSRKSEGRKNKELELQYTKQKLIEVNKDTEKLQRDFDVLLPAIDRKNRQKKKNQY